MSDRLKTFINLHRHKFDSHEPSTDLWKKIDAKMELKDPSRINHNWLSKFKYFGFSASVLVIALYFITKNTTTVCANELSLNKKVPKLRSIIQKIKIAENENTPYRKITELPVNNSEIKGIVNSKDRLPVTKINLVNVSTKKADSSLTTENIFSKNISASEKKDNNFSNASKTGFYIPAEPVKANTYSGTIYNGSSICELLHVYKFPGAVIKGRSKGKKVRHNLGTKETVRTVSCSRLESVPGIKAVWLKGKTDKEIALLLKEGFKDIVLIKKDGKQLAPIAISHYYSGLGVIKDYKGKDLPMIFKNKVELLLFFNDIEAGDKLLINDLVETVVQNKP